MTLRNILVLTLIAAAPILQVTDLQVQTLHAQEIVTGLDLFDQVAENYNQIRDYSASISMNIGSNEMRGTVYYSAPNLLRIDFNEPAEQVLVSDGQVIQIYVPAYNVTLTQRLNSPASVGAFASGQGLNLLRRNYQIAYSNSPNLQPLSEENPSELVYKLFLTWRNTAQGFREIELDISPDLFIRRMTALTSNYRRVVFAFENFRINEGIPQARFEYNSPPSSNNFDNFLYGVE